MTWKGPQLSLLLLCGMGLLVATAQAIVVPFTALYARELGASPTSIGVVVATGFLVPLVAAVRVGKFVDRFGVRTVLALGAGVLFLSVLPVWSSPGLISLAALMVLAHLGHVSCIITAQRAVASSIRSREVAFGWFTTSVSLGQLVGPLVMGVAIDVVGFWGGLASVAVAAFGALALAIVMRSALPTDETVPLGEPVSVRRELGRRPGALLAIGGSGSVLFVMGAHQTFYPVFLDSVGVSALLIGVILSVRALAAILVRPFLAMAIRWAGSRALVFLGSLVLCAIGIAVPLVAAPLVLAALASALIGVGSGLAQPMSMVLVADQAPSRLHGSLLGTRMAVNYAGLGSSTILLGAVVGAVGYVPAFLASGLLPGILAVAVFGRRELLDAAVTGQ